jgi:hypothetical protein
LRLVTLVLQLVGQLLKASWKIMFVAVSTAVYLLTLPFALLHKVVERVRWERRDRAGDVYAGHIVKPDWALSREV